MSRSRFIPNSAHCAADVTPDAAAASFDYPKETLRNFMQISGRIHGEAMSLQTKHIYEFGPFRLDAAEHLLLRDGEAVPLTPKAFDLLLALVERHGHLVEKDELMKKVWPDTFVEETNLTSNISQLRKALGDGENGERYIETAPKRGYRFVAGVREVQAVLDEDELLPEQAPRVAERASDAKIILREIFRRKLSVIAALAVLLIAVSGAAYFVFFAPRTTASIDAIAVLPFVNGSGDQDLEYLSDGLSESLIDRLAQLPRLKVIARSSSFKYKGREVDPQEIAQALGVQGIITGRVTQRGDSLMIHAELVNARDKTQIWGEQYQRKAGDALALQAEIAREIAERLHARLTAREQEQLARRETANPKAYELVLKGNFSRNKDVPEARKKAVEYYQQALALDPNYALAYAQLSRGLVISGALPEQEARARAEAAARKAVELDEALPQARLALARVEMYNWNWAAAQWEFQRALALNPNLADAHQEYAGYLDLMGQHEQAIAEAKRSLSLDPLSLRASLYIGFLHYSARQFDRAIEALQETIEFDPSFSPAHLILGYVYAAKQMYPEAIAAYEKAIQLGDQTTSAQIYLGYALAKAGRRAEAQAIHNNLNRDAHYDSLRADPRFQRLVRRVGLP
jgi:TolB-like protein/DNA-binding winged helix-turn-helix (wHTH) protein/Tfp pilus assembly protein PilF